MMNTVRSIRTILLLGAVALGGTVSAQSRPVEKQDPDRRVRIEEALRALKAAQEVGNDNAAIEKAIKELQAAKASLQDPLRKLAEEKRRVEHDAELHAAHDKLRVYRKAFADTELQRARLEHDKLLHEAHEKNALTQESATALQRALIQLHRQGAMQEKAAEQHKALLEAELHEQGAVSVGQALAKRHADVARARADEAEKAEQATKHLLDRTRAQQDDRLRRFAMLEDVTEAQDPQPAPQAARGRTSVRGATPRPNTRSVGPAAGVAADGGEDIEALLGEVRDHMREIRRLMAEIRARMDGGSANAPAATPQPRRMRTAGVAPSAGVVAPVPGLPGMAATPETSAGPAAPVRLRRAAPGQFPGAGANAPAPAATTPAPRGGDSRGLPPRAPLAPQPPAAPAYPRAGGTPPPPPEAPPAPAAPRVRRARAATGGGDAPEPVTVPVELYEPVQNPEPPAEPTEPPPAPPPAPAPTPRQVPVLSDIPLLREVFTTR